MCLWEAFCLLKMPLQIQRESSGCSQISGTRNCLIIFKPTEICLCAPPSHSNSFLQPHLLLLPLPCSSSHAAYSTASTVFHPKRKGETPSVLPHELVRSGVLALCEQTLHKLNFNSRKIFPSSFFGFFNFKCTQSRLLRWECFICSLLMVPDSPRRSRFLGCSGCSKWVFFLWNWFSSLCS